MSAADPGAEPVDVLDAEGRVVGCTTRRDMRRRRLPHRCVYILVFDARGRLFVHLRTAGKDIYPSHWDAAVGGVLAAGESFDDGARRELAEELGVTAPLTPLFPFRYEDRSTVAHAVVYATVHDGPFVLQPEEVVEGRFLGWRELDELVARQAACPDSQAVVAEYRRRYGDEGLAWRTAESSRSG
ncbi:MAG TPA: NUDIX domain-containing protein [Candidatus Limnocylindria bacterium]|nr:NUDIX domain-containing protein [Candidatus Limnocylindria bacterium]